MFSSLHTHESVSRGSRVRRKRKNANHLNHKFETYFSWGNFAFVHCFSLRLSGLRSISPRIGDMLLLDLNAFLVQFASK